VDSTFYSSILLDEATAVEYYQTMPWKMLSYSETTKTQELAVKYGIRTIPSLVLIDPQGNVITTGGRSVIESTPFDCITKIGCMRDHVAAKVQALGLEGAARDALVQFCPPTINNYRNHMEHPLIKTQSLHSGIYKCSSCQEDGSGVGYHCTVCQYDIHPECILCDVYQIITR
jgi:nucleoredoxin